MTLKLTLQLYLLIFLAIISNQTLHGQSNDTWTAFWNKDTTLIGYKDKNGVVKIEPKFKGFTNAAKFDNIIAVTEVINGNWKSYYLTKQGKIVGRDSFHLFDNSFDCESEGFIRFRDRINDKVGMFDRRGDVAIPAIYNVLTRVTNGMIVAIKDAEKKYREGGEHYSWTGGRQLLIDTNNHILIDSFKSDKHLNFFSLKNTRSPHTDPTRISFLAKDGSYFSFVDFEIEFRQWILKELLNGLTKEKLISISYDTITWASQDGWARTNKSEFITDNFTILSRGLSEIIQPETNYFITTGGLNPFMFEGQEFEKYFNNCGEPKDWMYPTMTIIISHKGNKDFTQNHYEFLRTDHGYKLISLTIGNEKLK